MPVSEELLFDDPWADEVCAQTSSAGALWLAWASARLEAECVRLARLTDPATSPPEPIAWIDPFPEAAHAARPALAQSAGVCVLGAVTAAPDAEPGELGARFVWFEDEGGQVLRRWQAPGDPNIVGVAVSRHAQRDLTWVALARSTRQRVWIELYFIESSQHPKKTRMPPMDHSVWRRQPALVCDHGACWVSWVEGDEGTGQVRVASVTPGRPVTPRWIAHPAGAQSAPALLGVDDGLIIAWHEHVGAGRRWLSAARLKENGELIARVDLPEPPALDRASASTDQGWERPALGAGPGGERFLVGRSAHNFHACQLNSEGSGPRVAQSAPGWGGIGGRASLVSWQGQLWLARRQRGGLMLSPLRTEQTFEPAGPAATGAEEVAAPATPALNQFALSDEAPEPFGSILFGDLHQHSAASDGTGEIEEVLAAARRRGLDFTALTDHDRFCKRAIGPVTWGRMIAAAEFHDDPERFTVLHAYEFTGARPPGPGHKNLYFLESLPAALPDHTTEELKALVREHPAVVIPHHVGFTGDDLEHHDPELQPLWEICSVHGTYEEPDQQGPFPPRDDFLIPDQTLRQALEAGHRFGFCGGTDNHGLLYHHGVTPRRDPGSTGLTATVGAANTRAEILEAMRARRTYATTGARILMAVTLDREPMGASLPRANSLELEVWLRPTSPLVALELVRRGEVLGLPVEGGALERCTLEVSMGGRAWDYLYVRARQEDGDMAWASPFFVGEPEALGPGA